MELHEGRFILGVDQAERVDAEALNVAQRARDGAVRHRPHQHVHALGHQRDEIPEVVVRGGGLRESAVRLHLHGMHEVGELHRVLDEEHRDVVADEVEVAFLGIELHGESAHVARRVDRTRAARHRREADEDLGAPVRILQEIGLGQARQTLQRLEVAVCTAAAGMDDALGNALVIEVGDLFAEDEILQEGRAAGAGFQRVLIVGNRNALIGGQRVLGGDRGLVCFAALAPAGSSILLTLRLFHYHRSCSDQGVNVVSGDSVPTPGVYLPSTYLRHYVGSTPTALRTRK